MVEIITVKRNRHQVFAIVWDTLKQCLFLYSTMILKQLENNGRCRPGTERISFFKLMYMFRLLRLFPWFFFSIFLHTFYATISHEAICLHSRFPYETLCPVHEARLSAWRIGS